MYKPCLDSISIKPIVKRHYFWKGKIKHGGYKVILRK